MSSKLGDPEVFDIAGRKLSIGDIVSYLVPKSRDMGLGEVTRFTAKRVALRPVKLEKDFDGNAFVSHIYKHSLDDLSIPQFTTLILDLEVRSGE